MCLREIARRQREISCSASGVESNSKGGVMQSVNQLSKSVRTRALTTVSTFAIAAHSLLGAHVAHAAAAQPQAAAVEEVVVTGSRIVREGYEAPTPLAVMNVEALENSATANVADALKDMPVFAGAATPATQQV